MKGTADRFLSRDELRATADTIQACQLSNGMVQWFEGGHADPWNHVEAAMALATAGRLAAAERAYEWLRTTQLPDGAWRNYYRHLASLPGDGRHRNHRVLLARDRGGNRLRDLLAAAWRGAHLVSRRRGYAGRLRPAHRVVVGVLQPPLRGGVR